MTPDRSSAYGRVIKTLSDMGPSKLHDLERMRIRNAADTLLFAAGIGETPTDFGHFYEHGLIGAITPVDRGHRGGH